MWRGSTDHSTTKSRLLVWLAKYTRWHASGAQLIQCAVAPVSVRAAAATRLAIQELGLKTFPARGLCAPSARRWLQRSQRVSAFATQAKRGSQCFVQRQVRQQLGELGISLHSLYCQIVYFSTRRVQFVLLVVELLGVALQESLLFR